MTPSQRVVFQAYKRMWRVAAFAMRPKPRGASVLLYHNIDDAPSTFVRRLGVTMSTRQFEEHLRFLVKSRRIVPFSQLADNHHDPRVVAITFDDGYRTVRTVALPILERLGVPFKAYVLARPTTGEANWLNQLSYLLDTCSKNELVELAKQALGQTVHARHLSDATPFVENFVEGRTPQAIREAFDRHCTMAIPRLYLDDADIRALAEHPLVELGSHTRNHFPLHRVSDATLEAEVVGAHIELTDQYGAAIDGFCVPFGYRHHLTETVVETVKSIDRAVVSAYGGRTGAHHVHGVPEIRRIGAWSNLGVLWHQLRYEP